MTFMKGLPLLLLVASLCSHAALQPDRTRIVFNANDKATSLRVDNRSNKLPYLAYSWLENEKGEKSDEEGKEMILSYLNQGDFIGELGLFEEGQERSAWVRAKTACEVAEISYKKFRQLIQVNPDILMRLSAQMARRLQVTSEKVGNLAFLDVTGRIAQTLLNLAKQPDAMTHPDGMQIKITRQEIGQIVGCSRETVGRILKMLEDQNLISAHGKTIVVYGTR